MSDDRKILVTEAEWRACVDAYWKRVLASWKRSDDYEGDPALEKFFKSGDVKAYIQETLSQGENPGCSWSYVLACNPSRDFSKLKENIQIFWTWILENPQERLPNALDLKNKVPAQEYFEEAISRLGSVNTSVLDPVCSAKLFLWVYGETFEAVRLFPMPLGSDDWQPVIKAEPEDMFFKIMELADSYLFEEEQKIKYRQALVLIDYWFSTIPLLHDLRVFDTFLYEDEDEDKDEVDDKGIEFYKKQWSVRSFIANLLGYNVWSEEVDVLPHNDPNLEKYIKDKLVTMEMPVEYHRLVEFIHKHKGGCLEASE